MNLFMIGCVVILCIAALVSSKQMTSGRNTKDWFEFTEGAVNFVTCILALFFIGLTQ
jgi:Na+/phosphate symporter